MRQLITVSALAAALALPARAGTGPQSRDLSPVTGKKAPSHPPVEIVREGRPKAVVYVADRDPSANLKRLVAELVEVVRLST